MSDKEQRAELIARKKLIKRLSVEAILEQESIDGGAYDSFIINMLDRFLESADKEEDLKELITQAFNELLAEEETDVE